MAIINPKAPDGGLQIVQEYVGRALLETPSFFSHLQIEDLVIDPPHQCFSVGLHDLALGHLRSAAKFICWRYILSQKSNAIGEADLKATGTVGKQLKFVALHRTHFSNATLVALQNAKTIPQVKRLDYEIRFLKILGLYFVAVWLHSQSDDIFIPLPPTYGHLDPDRYYSESQIVENLQPRAKAKMETIKAMTSPNIYKLNS